MTPTNPDELASQWLDGEGLDGAEGVNLDALSPADRNRLADLQWMDALLQAVHVPDAARETRICRVLSVLEPAPAEIVASTSQAVDAGENVVSVPFASRASSKEPRKWWWSSVAVAAAALMLAYVWHGQSPSAGAYAAVQGSLAEAQQAADRQYRVLLELTGPLGAARELEAALYVRGGEKFVLRHPAPAGEAWAGGRRDQSWYVPAMKLLPVRVSDDPQLVRHWMEEGRVSFSQPFLQVTSILAQFGDRYDLEMLPSETLPGAINGPATRIRGRRRAAQAPWPPVIELWTDPATGVARKLVLDWQDGAQRPGLQRVSLELSGERTQPADWYEHTAHHHPARPVVHDPFP